MSAQCKPCQIHLSHEPDMISEDISLDMGPYVHCLLRQKSTLHHLILVMKITKALDMQEQSWKEG